MRSGSDEPSAFLTLRWRHHTLRVGPLPKEVHEALPALLGVEATTAAHGETAQLLPVAQDAEGRPVLEDGAPLAPADLIARLACIVWFQLVDETDGIVVHAAAVGRQGVATLLLGPGRVGKSSLAYAAWRAGLEVLGDDRLLLDPAKGTVEALPRPLSLRERDGAFPPSLAELPEGACSIGSAFGERRATLSRSLPGMTRTGEAFAVDRLVLLERMDESGVAVAEVRREEILQGAVEALVGNERRPLQVLRPLLKLGERRRACRLRVGPGATEEAVALLFGRGHDRSGRGGI
ncbi:MAG: hypothetical protein U1E45_05585 [Geminicoccaceae bacterium]